MSDRFYPPDLEYLLTWILNDLNKDHLFGIPDKLFYQPDARLFSKRFGQHLETPLGVAAGPHTQLAANIVTAWICGARFMELKTVQTLDELEISKPCIDMPDEGYNCEWSQELKLGQSLDEYLNAWILIHVLQHRLGWPGEEGSGVIFNMSVGYNLEGILQANVQEFLDLMEDASELLVPKIDQLTGIYPDIEKLHIPTLLSDSITLSTMHGCPPDEIERIGRYLIEERKLHTAIKLNPTLLGPDLLRQILHEELGHEQIAVPDPAFEHDLKYPDAVRIIQALSQLAERQGVEFALKLTNTLEVLNQRDVFPENEQQAYLSGRALHPISVNLAAKLQNDFHGKLDISFCAGADAFNFPDLIASGLGPVTTCTDLLKPGGYMRLQQYLENLESKMNEVGARDLRDFIKGREVTPLEYLDRYAKNVRGQQAYQQVQRPFESIKNDRVLGEFDCISAPCIKDCAANQDIPGYIYHTAQGDFEAAFDTIMDTNPLPGITGNVCDHLCQPACTRNNYDHPLMIRDIKRFVTERHTQTAGSGPPRKSGQSAAVIGAGPAGLTAAYFLAREGFEVDVFEARPESGGMTSMALPEFRLGGAVIRLDIERIQEMGVKFHYGFQVEGTSFREIREKFGSVFIGIGAQASRKLSIPGEDLPGVMDPLLYLGRLRRGEPVELGDKIVVIGGGNTAMDAARTARRLAGIEADVRIVYRRSRREMPADFDEVREALEEGVRLMEQVMPLEVKSREDGSMSLTCCRVELGEPEADGRRRPFRVPDSDFTLPATSIIPAVGQVLRLDFIEERDLEVDPATGATAIPGVFAGGDAVRGAASIVQAIGDGQRAAEAILGRGKLSGKRTRKALELKDYRILAGKRDFARNDPIHGSRLDTDEEAILEARRCLYCDDYCSVCVGVCPNLANLTYEIQPESFEIHLLRRSKTGVEAEKTGKRVVSQGYQVLNIADLCNECGNCTTFCPSAGDPYLDKPRLHLSADAYADADSGYHFTADSLLMKENGSEYRLVERDHSYHFEVGENSCELNKDDLSVIQARLDDRVNTLHTAPAARMAVLLKNLPGQLPLAKRDHSG